MKTKAVHGLCILAAGLVAQSALASKAFVSTSGGNVSPYDSWENAATTLEAALLVRPDEVEIGDGTFTHTVAKHIIDWPCYIHSSNGPVRVCDRRDGAADLDRIEVFPDKTARRIPCPGK